MTYIPLPEEQALLDGTLEREERLAKIEAELEEDMMFLVQNVEQMGAREYTRALCRNVLDEEPEEWFRELPTSNK